MTKSNVKIAGEEFDNLCQIVAKYSDKLGEHINISQYDVAPKHTITMRLYLQNFVKFKSKNSVAIKTFFEDNLSSYEKVENLIYPDRSCKCCSDFICNGCYEMVQIRSIKIINVLPNKDIRKRASDSLRGQIDNARILSKNDVLKTCLKEILPCFEKISSVL